MDKHIIGENAGTLWQLLNEDNRKWELTEIKEATGFDDMELASAIGWLAREDKIQFECLEIEKERGVDIFCIHSCPSPYVSFSLHISHFIFYPHFLNFPEIPFQSQNPVIVYFLPAQMQDGKTIQAASGLPVEVP